MNIRTFFFSTTDTTRKMVEEIVETIAEVMGMDKVFHHDFTLHTDGYWR